MLAILRAKEKRLKNESVVCETMLPVVLASLQQGGEAVEESCTRSAAPTGVVASLKQGGKTVEESCIKTAAPTVKSGSLKKGVKVVEESCYAVTSPIAGPAVRLEGGLEFGAGGTARAGSGECKDELCLLNVCGIEQKGQTNTLSLTVRATPQASAVRVKPQARTVRASHQTLVKRFSSV